MAKKKNFDTRPPAAAKPSSDGALAETDPFTRAIRAFRLRGRAAGEVGRLDEQELAAFAKLVTQDLDPAGADFGDKFDKLWTAHQVRLAAPPKAAEAAEPKTSESQP